MEFYNKIAFSFLLFFFSNLLIADANIEKLASDDWLQLKSKNFEIITDMDEPDGRALIEDLENYRSFSVDMLKRDIVGKVKPLKILAVSGSSNFKRLGLPENWAGVFHMSEMGYSAIANVHDYRIGLKKLSFGRQVLFHEYNHFLVRFLENTTVFPPWYDEGAAEYFGTFKFDGEKVTLGDPDAISGRFYGVFNNAGSFTLELEKLLKTTELPSHSNSEKDKKFMSDFYGRAFTTVHYLNSSAELRAQLDTYLDHLSKGYSVDAAFTQAFHTTFVEMEAKIKKSVTKSLYLRVLTIKDGKIEFKKPDIYVTKLDQAMFYASTYDILLAFEGQDQTHTRNLLAKTLALNPKLIDIKVQMLMRGFSDDYAKDFLTIVNAEPQTSLSFYYQGTGLFHQAENMRIAGNEHWQEVMKQARGFFRRAVKVDSTASFGYGGLGDVYKFLPATEPLQEGAVCLDSAAMHRRNRSTFEDLALLSIRQNLGVDALPSLRAALAFSKDKSNSAYRFLLNNLEILNDTSHLIATSNSTGLAYNDGGLYEGPVAQNKPHGKGKFTRPNGAYFEGEFVNGEMQGLGKLVNEFNEIYEGDFKNGIARGQAKITSSNGTYIGDTEYTLRHGKGLFNSKSGIYEGEFWYGLRHGAATFKPKDLETTFTGRWNYGYYQWPAQSDVIFTGSIDNAGKANGFGVCENLKTKSISNCSFKAGIRQEKNDAPQDE